MIGSAPVIHFNTIDSTNLEAARRVTSGARGPQWIIADQQEAGRGRLGRSWVSEPGNLYSTLLCPVGAEPASVPQLAFVVALAVRDVAAALLPSRKVHLKWPNDCLLVGGKVAGILCEALADGHVAIGCGINIAHAPRHGLYPTACLGAQFTVDEVFAHYRNALAQRLAQWHDGAGFPSITDNWKRHAIGIDERIEVAMADTRLSGTFIGLAPSGALRLLQDDGTQTDIHAGDVFIPALQELRRIQ